ncbi:SDR family NAD(P)-dependent oxidoreductase [Gracilibacillus timonensis]|uniref:SDR family NAD(P)-dependent oxidoreductase n=1 Tax=Gracilibacillus timonensis TaxID=1816696 RepID=UPI000824F847|nr:SDR family oxidoreductase [Gracilibacillus timonensis]
MTGNRLKNKVAVVTGGGSGIGRETCLLFAEEGAQVVVVDRYESDAQNTVDLIADQGGLPALPATADVGSEKDIARVALDVKNKFNRVDILVNNAGVRVFGPITEADEETWQFIFDINLRAVGYCCKHFIPIMSESNGGSIVNVSSANGVVGRPGMGLYDATKAGVLALTRSMACDHAEEKLRVNAILPGPTLTDYHIKRAEAAGKELDQSVTKPNPDGPGILKRQGTPRELAYGILFLASDEASFVTGACLNVDGGLSALAQRN